MLENFACLQILHTDCISIAMLSVSKWILPVNGAQLKSCIMKVEVGFYDCVVEPCQWARHERPCHIRLSSFSGVWLERSLAGRHGRGHPPSCAPWHYQACLGHLSYPDTQCPGPLAFCVGTGARGFQPLRSGRPSSFHLFGHTDYDVHSPEASLASPKCPTPSPTTPVPDRAGYACAFAWSRMLREDTAFMEAAVWWSLGPSHPNGA